MHRKTLTWIYQNPEIQWFLAFIVPIFLVYLETSLLARSYPLLSELLILPAFTIGLLLVVYLRYSLPSRMIIGTIYVIFQLILLPMTWLLASCSVTDRCL
jgi:hypothetical protein